MRHHTLLAAVAIGISAALLTAQTASGAPAQASAATVVHAATSSEAVPDDRTVLSRGLAGITPRITDESHVELGVVDQTLSTRDSTKQTFLSPDRVILQIPTQDTAYPGGSDPASEIYQSYTKVYDPAQRYWSTPDAADVDPDRLLVSLYPGANYHKRFGSGFNADFRNDINGSFSYSMASVTGPGTLIAYQRPSSVWPLSEGKDPLWTTTDHSRTSSVSKGSATGDNIGLTFTQQGVYCLTLGVSIPFSSGVTTTAAATYTVVAGALPAHVPECTQPGDDGAGGQPVETPVVQYDHGHLDVRPGIKDDELRLGIDSSLVPFERAVLSGTQRGTVPASIDGVGTAFFGDVGEPYWFFPASISADTDETGRTQTWPGFSTESIDASQVRSPITVTLTGVSGPGDVALWGDTGGYDPLFSTRLGLPMSYEFSTNTHFHSTWSFTRQGVYCLALTARAQLADGHWSSAAGQLTVVAGDEIDPRTVTPCERGGASAPLQETRAAPHDLADGAAVYQDGRVRADVFIGDHGVDVASAYRTTMAGPTEYRRLERAILSTAFESGGAWTITGTRAGRSPEFSVTATSLKPGDLAQPGVTRIDLGEVAGPGEVAIGLSEKARLGSSADAPKRYLIAPQGTTRAWQWSFSAPGVYCIPLTFTVQTAAGAEQSVTKILTAVAGPEDRFPRQSIVPCADGGAPTPPGGDDGHEPTPQWNVPNGSLTASGARILNNGHIDVASVLENGALETRIKDTTLSSEPVWRATDATVLQLLPDAETTVPDASAYRFLGEPGSRVWQVTETQQAGLIWPGWSTEAISADATVGGVTWALTKTSGPGEFSLYTSSPTQLGAVEVRFSTRDGITDADSFTIPKNTHAHGSWAFSAEGVYCLAFTRSATLASGGASSSEFTLAIAVGRTAVTDVDPGACFTAQEGQPTSDDTTPIPVGELTDANRGDVHAADAGSGFSAGQLLTLVTGEARRTQWLSVWWDDASWLGWVRADREGIVAVRLPADATPGSHRLVLKDQAGSLVGWVELTVAKAAPPHKPDDGSNGAGAVPPVRDVAPTQCLAGATILSSGHIDYATRVVGGSIRSLVGDDTSGSKVYREPADTVLWLKPSSRVTLPSGYGAIGQAGAPVWQVPQTQNLDLIWLGWNTESLNDGNTRGPVEWTVESIDGPGTVHVYLSGSFGGVQEVVFAGRGSYRIPLGVHAHANWAFSAQGIYRIRMTQSATLANGQLSTDTETLTIAVGDLDPASAVGAGAGCGTVPSALLLSDAASAAPAAAPAVEAPASDERQTVENAPSTDAGPADPFAALASGNPVPLLLSVLGVLLLAGAIGAGALWWTRRRTGRA